jgi:hypothetical protein
LYREFFANISQVVTGFAACLISVLGPQEYLLVTLPAQQNLCGFVPERSEK